MNSKSNKLTLILKIIFYGLVVILSLIGWIKSNHGLTLNVGYVLFILAIAGILIFSIFQLIDDPKKSIKSLAGLAVLIIIFFIAYSTTSVENLKEGITESYARLVGSGLVLLYVMGGVAIFSIIVSEIYSMFK